MAYQIQKLKLGGILDQAVSITKQHFGLLFTIMALVYIPAVLLMGFMQQAMLPEPITFDSTPEEIAAFQQAQLQAFPMLVGPLLISAFILLPLANAAVVYAVAQSYLGNAVSAMDAIKVGLGRLLPLIWTSILVGLAVLGGFILFIIPGVIFAFWFCLSTHVVVLENQSGGSALSRSRELMRGNILTALVLGLLIWAISFGIGMISGIIPQPHIQLVSSVILQSVMTIFATAAMVVFYFSCRCGLENFDLEHLAQSMGESAEQVDTEGDTF